jgi:hypothetical protein
MVRITEQEAFRLGIAPSLKPKAKKYNNKPCKLNGLKFDSIKERDYYLLLLARQKKGEISGLTLQEPIEILPAFTDSRGVKHKPITYRADFTYIEDSAKHFIDVKGGKATQTPVYKLKKKLLAYKGIYLEEV